MRMVAVEIYELIVKIDGFPVINKLNLLINEGDSIDISCENFPLTLLRILCGFELPDIGEIWFYNLPPRQLSSEVSFPCQCYPAQTYLSAVFNLK